MYPGHFAKTVPDKTAVAMAGGHARLSYRALDRASRELADALVGHGLDSGERVAILMSNRLEFIVAAWAGLRAGLRVVPIDRFRTPEEIAYILNNSDAKVVLCSEDLSVLAARLPSLATAVQSFVMLGGSCPGYQNLDEFLRAHQGAASNRKEIGAFMFYTSGSTGRPRGVIRPLPGSVVEEGYTNPSLPMLQLSADSRMLISTPLYHSGSLPFSMMPFSYGGTLIIADKFDPVSLLGYIQEYQITHAYLVPTMFRRLLQLPEEQRREYDTTSLQLVVHLAEPCPRNVKEEMIKWWGPIIWEAYGTSEFRELTWISTQEWLSRPGSVGRPFGFDIHILDGNLQECAPGTAGHVHVDSASARNFWYHKDEKTALQRHTAQGWFATGDIGYVDEEGYLYLADRKEFMIISAGINIYPSEVENVLMLHERVADTAVFGLPDALLGERTVAVIVAKEGVESTEQLKEELFAYCLQRLGRHKCPVQFFFEPSLPRSPSGKIYKQTLQDKYRSKTVTP